MMARAIGNTLAPGRCADLRVADRERQQAEQRRQDRHQDRPQAVAAGLQDRVVSRQAGLSQVDDVRDQHDAMLTTTPISTMKRSSPSS